jgi:hypothetical protein
MVDSLVATVIQLTVVRLARFAGTRLPKVFSMQRSLPRIRLNQFHLESRSFRPIIYRKTLADDEFSLSSCHCGSTGSALRFGILNASSAFDRSQSLIWDFKLSRII